MQFVLWVILVIFSLPVWAQSQTARFENSQVSLISSNKIISSNEEFQLGILIELDDKWHTYWKNGGDTGFPARITWHLPDGGVISEPEWPAPQKMIIDNSLVNYVHEDKLLLSHNITLPNQKIGDRVPIYADVSWLMCHEVCIPATVTVATEILVSDKSKIDDGLKPLFAQTKLQLPKQLNVDVKVIRNKKHYQLSFSMNGFEKAEFIPNIEGTIVDLNDQNFEVKNGFGYLTLMADPYEEKTEKLSGLLQLTANSNKESFYFSSDIIKGEIIPDKQNIQTESDMTLLLAIIFAFIAGLILNLMPCVLPVLFLKIMGLVHHAHGKYNKTHLLSFLVGVLLPFWGLGISLVILKQAGESLGWGFHLQSPAFIAVLVVIMLLVTLNLFGMFEFGTSVTKAGSKLKQTEGHGGSFASGVLMTIVATPCTVPFMGGALAYGLSHSASVALAIFTSLGVGMATPYMFLALMPKALKIIPKPGKWMENFRKILGIPMLITVAWLYWVFYHQVDESSVNAFAFALLAIVFSSWIFGKFGSLNSPEKHKRYAVFAMLSALLCAGYVAFSANPKVHTKFNNEVWEEWSQESVDTALSLGYTVFIDFTADWCITCQVIDQTVLSLEKTQKLFEKHEVVLFKADWTLYNKNITKALDSYGRKGVPLYVLHKNGNKQGLVLPQIITYSSLEENLAK